jgi:uncharacterized membrane protein YphA (DoxX/SURF4 family)
VEDGVASSNRAATIAAWVVTWTVTVLLVLEFAYAGGIKLVPGGPVTEGFRRFGYSDEFRILIGVLEVAGAVGLLVPRLASWAAAGLAAIMVGAVYTHLSSGVPGVRTAATTLVLCLFVAYARRAAALWLGAPSAGPAAPEASR